MWSVGVAFGDQSSAHEGNASGTANIKRHLLTATKQINRMTVRFGGGPLRSLQWTSLSPLRHFLLFAHVLCPQSSRGVTTWSLLAMFSCTSTWAPSPGKASRPLPRDRSMNESARRKCPHPLRFSAKDTPVSTVCGASTCSNVVMFFSVWNWLGMTEIIEQ